MENLRRHKLAAKVEQLNKETIEAVLSTKEGRLFVCQLLDRAHPFIQSFTPDRDQTSFREGERSVGLWVLSYFPSMKILDQMREEQSKEITILSEQIQKEMEGQSDG